MENIGQNLFLVVGLALLAGCAEQPASVAPESTPAPSLQPAHALPPPKEETAPAVFRIDFETSQGPFVVEVVRAQAPHGADRLYSLVMANYFDGARFYRVVPNFVVQWGAAADPAVTTAWHTPILDDPVKTTNARGTLTFAAPGTPNSRSTHMFINFADNAQLDDSGFAPVGKVVRGMETVDKIYPYYGERPDQGRIRAEGNSYLAKMYPKLDYIKTARIAP
jgi:peptidyl-prolyl cis-trans isomerase A (cyclophilin A)